MHAEFEQMTQECRGKLLLLSSELHKIYKTSVHQSTAPQNILSLPSKISQKMLTDQRTWVPQRLNMSSSGQILHNFMRNCIQKCLQQVK